MDPCVAPLVIIWTKQTACVLFVLAGARLDTFAGADWSGYNFRFFHSCWLQHRCDEHSSTCETILIFYSDGKVWQKKKKESWL